MGIDETDASLEQLPRSGYLVGPNNSHQRTSSTKLGPMNTKVRAVLWDFGGVILSSPFDAFARYEASAGLPHGTIRSLNATNPDANAWARFERNEVTLDEFCVIFEAEAEAAGHVVSGRAVMGLLHGEVRPQMVEAVRRCKSAGFLVACLTNNVRLDRRDDTAQPERTDFAEVMSLFDHVTESSLAGIRKPERRFYELACEALSIAPTEAVFLDDLGINLKPAAAMGMHTIKVGDPDIALDELSVHIGIALR
jgi:putative hydrolase of the HAD superfamily